MVHALREAWRVLVPGGCLIDLRPLAKDPPLEVIVDDQVEYLTCGFYNGTIGAITWYEGV